ncbi:MAG: hypothetical protein VX642_07720 [Bdellovibrionota bacterium]|nr:hypothetical protein [Bdellovibrionota bacterium]
MKLILLIAMMTFCKSIYANTTLNEETIQKANGDEHKITKVLVEAGGKKVLTTSFKDAYEPTISIIIEDQETARKLFEKSMKPKGSSCEEKDVLKEGELYKNVLPGEKVLVGFCFKVCENEYHICSINFNY